MDGKKTLNKAIYKSAKEENKELNIRAELNKIRNHIIEASSLVSEGDSFGYFILGEAVGDIGALIGMIPSE